MSGRNSPMLAGWLFDNKLLREEELAKFTATRHLPADFSDRVLSRWGAAVPVAMSDRVRSQCVTVVEEFIPPAPPTLTYDGPLPREFALENIPEYRVMLHEVEHAKMFVGYERSTLILDDRRYFRDISSPASSWITPAFAHAPADLALNGTVAVLFANGATLFGHWMFDLLPKFEILRRSGWTDRNIDHYIVNSTNTDFSKESLSRLGIPPQKVIRASGCLVSADKLLVPSRLRRRFRTPEWIRQFVVSQFLSNGGSAECEPLRERIYISRARARRRRILNETDVQAFLESRGFSTVFAENMRIAELAHMVHRSKVVVAPHGAGITNVAFAQAGVRVLEVFGAHIISEGWLMTKAAGGEYFLLAGRGDSGRYCYEEPGWDSAGRNARNEADYTVDMADLSRAVGVLDSP